MATKHARALIPGTCKYGMLQGKRHSADAIKVMTDVEIRREIREI